jgi:hypothetical protein
MQGMDDQLFRGAQGCLAAALIYALATSSVDRVNLVGMDHRKRLLEPAKLNTSPFEVNDPCFVHSAGYLEDSSANVLSCTLKPENTGRLDDQVIGGEGEGPLKNLCNGPSDLFIGDMTDLAESAVSGCTSRYYLDLLGGPEELSNAPNSPSLDTGSYCPIHESCNSGSSPLVSP